MSRIICYLFPAPFAHMHHQKPPFCISVFQNSDRMGGLHYSFYTFFRRSPSELDFCTFSRRSPSGQDFCTLSRRSLSEQDFCTFSRKSPSELDFCTCAKLAVCSCSTSCLALPCFFKQLQDGSLCLCHCGNVCIYGKSVFFQRMGQISDLWCSQSHLL